MAATTTGWTGDRVLSMADDGRLVVRDVDAQRVVANIEQTLGTLQGYLDDLSGARASGAGAFTELRQEAIDVCLADMAEPGWLARSLDELSTFAEAFRLATRLAGEPASGQ